MNYIVTFGFVLAAGMFHGKGHMRMAGAVLVMFAAYRQLGRYRLSKNLIPPELWAYSLWALWSLMTGVVIAKDAYVFWYNMKVLAQMVIMLWAAAALFLYQRQASAFYWAILVVAIMNVVAVVMGVDLTNVQGEMVQKDLSASWDATNRLSGLTGNANTLAFLFLYGIWAVVMLCTSIKSIPRFIKIIVATGLISVFFYYVLKTASRKSLFCLGVLLFGTLAYVFPGKKKGLKFIMMLICGIALPMVVGYIMGDTLVGNRLQYEIDAGGGSLLRGFREANIRYQFIVDGLKMWLAHPIWGIGLGQFSVVHWSGLYSHSDYIEPLACTGIVGFFLYHWCAFSVLRRLYKLTKRKLPNEIEFQCRGMLVGMVSNYYLIGLGAPHWSSQVAFLIVIFCGAWSYRVWREYTLGRNPIGS